MFTTKLYKAMRCCYDCGQYSLDARRVPDFMLGHVSVCAKCLPKHRDSVA